MEHKFTPQNIEQLKQAVRNLRDVQISVESDIAAYTKLDDIMGSIEDLIDIAEAE